MPAGVFFKVTLPPKLDEKAFMAELSSAAHSLGETIKKDFEATTENWAGRPLFTIEVIDTPIQIGVWVGTDDKVYTILNNGAREHDITGKPYLYFESGPYHAKTSPRGGTSQSRMAKALSRLEPTRAPGDLIRTTSVHHPGVQARKWDEQIVEKRRIWAQRLLSLSLARACQKSKYGG